MDSIEERKEEKKHHDLPSICSRKLLRRFKVCRVTRQLKENVGIFCSWLKLRLMRCKSVRYWSAKMGYYTASFQQTVTDTVFQYTFITTVYQYTVITTVFQYTVITTVFQYTLITTVFQCTVITTVFSTLSELQFTFITTVYQYTVITTVIQGWRKSINVSRPSIHFYFYISN